MAHCEVAIVFTRRGRPGHQSMIGLRASVIVTSEDARNDEATSVQPTQIPLRANLQRVRTRAGGKMLISSKAYQRK